MLAESGPMKQLNHSATPMFSPTEITVKEAPYVLVSL